MKMILSVTHHGVVSNASNTYENGVSGLDGSDLINEHVLGGSTAEDYAVDVASGDTIAQAFMVSGSSLSWVEVMRVRSNKGDWARTDSDTLTGRAAAVPALGSTP